MSSEDGAQENGYLLIGTSGQDAGPSSMSEAVADPVADGVTEADVNNQGQHGVEATDAVVTPAAEGPQESPAVPFEMTVRNVALIRILATVESFQPGEFNNAHPIGARVNPDGLNDAALLQESAEQGFSLQFENASFFWHPTDRDKPHVLYNATIDKWTANLWMGHPLSDPTNCRGGFYTQFQKERARIYVNESLNDPNLVYGLILRKWLALGADRAFLGLPNTDELGTPEGRGRFNHFTGGSIYWVPEAGAWSVRGAIKKWASLGWETGHLRYPVTDGCTTPDGIGRFKHSQGGSIYWHPNAGAWTIFGAIKDKWATLGWETGYLRYPVTDELTTPHGRGRYNHLQGGSIYWLPEIGAWYNHFEGGSIYWHPGLGAWSVYGAIKVKWAELEWETSHDLGYPKSDEQPTGNYGGRYQDFQRGWIYWSAVTGSTTVVKVDVNSRLPWYLEHTFRSGIPIGGHSNVTMHRDGTINLDGKVAQRGIIKLDYGIVYTIVDADNRSHSSARKGNVCVGIPDDVWHVESRQAVIEQQWRAIVAGDRRLRCKASVSADVLIIFRELLESIRIGFRIAHSVLLFIA